MNYSENEANPQAIQLDSIFELSDQELIAKAKPLGTNASNSTPPLSMGSTARLTRKQIKALPPELSSRIYRVERYWMQQSARKILIREGIKEGLQYPANYHKTAKCLHTRYGKSVEIHLSKEFNKAFYAGLVICGNVTACPVCAAKVQERRRIEIAKGFDYAWKTLYQKKMIMVTFTFPHYHWQKLEDLFSKQKAAFKDLRAGEPWTRIKDRIGYVSLIRSLEVTIGKNGWHPHTHEAWIVDRDCDVEKLLPILTQRWYNMCAKHGLVGDSKKAIKYFFKHSVHIMDNCHASDYLEKQGDVSNWGTDRELAKGVSKQGDKSSKGAHPFALLREFSEGNQGSGEKFLEYVKAMKRKRPIYWSKHFKKNAGVIDKTDEQIAEEEVDFSDLLSTLTDLDWSVVIKNNHRAEILTIAETLGAEGLEDYFDTQRRMNTGKEILSTEADINTVREREMIGRAFIKKVSKCYVEPDNVQKDVNDKPLDDDLSYLPDWEEQRSKMHPVVEIDIEGFRDG